MQALLIIAHGSRNQESNNELTHLKQRLEQLAHNYAQVALCFLEMATPTIQQAIDQLATTEPQRIDILPYFLAAGNHVAKDIPTIIVEVEKQHPDIVFSLLPHIGSHRQQAELILEHLNHYITTSSTR